MGVESYGDLHARDFILAEIMWHVKEVNFLAVILPFAMGKNFCYSGSLSASS